MFWETGTKLAGETRTPKAAILRNGFIGEILIFILITLTKN